MRVRDSAQSTNYESENRGIQGSHDQRRSHDGLSILYRDRHGAPSGVGTLVSLAAFLKCEFTFGEHCSGRRSFCVVSRRRIAGFEETADGGAGDRERSRFFPPHRDEVGRAGSS